MAPRRQDRDCTNISIKCHPCREANANSEDDRAECLFRDVRYIKADGTTPTWAVLTDDGDFDAAYRPSIGEAPDFEERKVILDVIKGHIRPILGRELDLFDLAQTMIKLGKLCEESYAVCDRCRCFIISGYVYAP